MFEIDYIPLVKYRWYTLAVQFSGKSVATAQCMGFNNEIAAMRYYDSAPWRTTSSVQRSTIIGTANDPRLIMKLGKFFARHASNIEFI